MGTQPLPKKGRAPQFSDHVYCGKTAGWINMTLGMEVGLSSGHTVLDRDPATLLQKGNRGPSQFSVHLSCGQMARWINMPLGAEVGLDPGDIAVRWIPSPLRESGTAAPTTF